VRKENDPPIPKQRRTAMAAKSNVGIWDFQTRRLTRQRMVGVIGLVLLNLLTRAMFAQQAPPGRIAYTVYPLGGTDPKELWLINSDLTNNQPLSPQIKLGGLTASVASIGVPVWSKDGHRIAANAILSSDSADLDPFQQIIWGQSSLATPTNVVVVFDPTTNPLQGNAVFYFDTNTGTATGLTSSLWINVSFSPDGQRLAYAQQGLNSVEYGVINIDGTGKVPLFFVNLTENALGLGIDWSPRTDPLGNLGNLLVVSYPQLFYDPTCLNIPRTVAALYLVDAQGKLIRQLTQPPQIPCSIWVFDTVNDLWPAFSPDGTQVAFVRSVRDSMGNVIDSCIMAVQVDGTANPPEGAGNCLPQPGERALLYLPGDEVDHLSWSPDGSRLMFDRTQMAYGGLYPNPLGIFTTSSAGSGDLTVFLASPATDPSWGRPQ
jgi:WD40 repeat protein